MAVRQVAHKWTRGQHQPLARRIDMPALD